ncbi:hypothetical protein [Arthrobacter castelli]|uniref:hypothetical protein n=1 Tax=Arthrobacter castelli TaxID=271431 RepID=UPI0012DF10C4|nr:hypothetical protein [Arthrobacter castelli]
MISTINTFADGFGRWRALVIFTHSLSESDLRPEFNLGHRWPRLRARARAMILNDLVDREQKTGESRPDAELRVGQSLPRLVVIAREIDSLNRWHGVTFGEA